MVRGAAAQSRFRRVQIAAIAHSTRSSSTTSSFSPARNARRKSSFHTFNALLEGQRQIVLTCDRYPKEVTPASRSVSSPAFGWGLTVAIDPPELETSVAILMSKAEAEKCELPEDVAFFIAKRIRSNVRELEGAPCAGSWQLAASLGEPINLDFAKEALRDLLALQATARLDREHSENRCRLLQAPRRGLVVEETQPLYSTPAADRDGAGQGADEPQPAGNRRCVRRSRSHDGLARLPAHRGAAGDRKAAGRGLFEPVKNADRMMWISRGQLLICAINRTLSTRYTQAERT